MTPKQLEPIDLENLRQLDSCSIANAIETFDLRLRNTGFTDSSIRCIFNELPHIAGYAATIRVRSSDPPMEGDHYFYRTDWLDHLLSVPTPRILVVQDLDRQPGIGAFIGDLHANILSVSGCVGVVTNGSVRNIPEVRGLGFQMYAGGISASHAFAHVVDFGTVVEVARLEVHPGDLLHGDLHGVQTVPFEIARNIPEVAREMKHQETELMSMCRSSNFNISNLRAAVDAFAARRRAAKR